jgi:hypothetical protein
MTTLTGLVIGAAVLLVAAFQLSEGAAKVVRRIVFVALVVAGVWGLLRADSHGDTPR